MANNPMNKFGLLGSYLLQVGVTNLEARQRNHFHVFVMQVFFSWTTNNQEAINTVKLLFEKYHIDANNLASLYNYKSEGSILQLLNYLKESYSSALSISRPSENQTTSLIALLFGLSLFVFTIENDIIRVQRFGNGTIRLCFIKSQDQVWLIPVNLDDNSIGNLITKEVPLSIKPESNGYNSNRYEELVNLNNHQENYSAQCRKCNERYGEAFCPFCKSKICCRCSIQYSKQLKCSNCCFIAPYDRFGINKEQITKYYTPKPYQNYWNTNNPYQVSRPPHYGSQGYNASNNSSYVGYQNRGGYQASNNGYADSRDYKGNTSNQYDKVPADISEGFCKCYIPQQIRIEVPACRICKKIDGDKNLIETTINSMSEVKPKNNEKNSLMSEAEPKNNEKNLLLCKCSPQAPGIPEAHLCNCNNLVFPNKNKALDIIEKFLSIAK